MKFRCCNLSQSGACTRLGFTPGQVVEQDPCISGMAAPDLEKESLIRSNAILLYVPESDRRLISNSGVPGLLGNSFEASVILENTSNGGYPSISATFCDCGFGLTLHIREPSVLEDGWLACVWIPTTQRLHSFSQTSWFPQTCMQLRLLPTERPPTRSA